MNPSRALLLLLLLGACRAQVKLEPPPARAAAVRHAIEHSELLDPPGCTGVEVADDVFVTAKHCVDDLAVAGDPFPSGGLLAYVSPNRDYVVFVTSVRYGYNFVPMRAAVPGEHLYLVGYPQQVRNGKQALTVTDGVFTGVVDEDGAERITAPAYFGNSGGGVWSEDGMLVGILVNGDFAPIGSWPIPYPGSSYMVPIAQVVEGLNASL